MNIENGTQIKGEVAAEEHEHDNVDVGGEGDINIDQATGTCTEEGDVAGEGGMHHRKHDKKHHAGVKHKHGKKHNNNNNNNNNSSHDVTSSDSALTTHKNDDHNDNDNHDDGHNDLETTAVIESLHLELNQLKVKISDLESLNSNLNQSMVQNTLQLFYFFLIKFIYI